MAQARRWTVWTSMILALASALAAFGVATRSWCQEPESKLSPVAGDAMFDQKNYQEAADAYAQALKAKLSPVEAHRVMLRLAISRIRLGQFDQAIADAEAQVERVKGTPWEALVHRLAGNLYLAVPHWGTRSGGAFHRGEHGQGVRLMSYTFDKQRAMAHLQLARNLYAAYDGDDKAMATLPAGMAKTWRQQRINNLFDLASAAARFGIYEDGPVFWYMSWGQRDEARAQSAGEADFDEQINPWELHRKRPLGLRVDDAGNPIFPDEPGNVWRDDLGDDQKILFLLDEIRGLDNTANREHAAKSWYRQAMLARARFGLDRMNHYAGMVQDGTGQPLQKEMESIQPWELKDDETILLAGGKVHRATLPPQWDALRLLRKVAREHPQSGIVDDALYGEALILQGRERYTAALAVHQQLIVERPRSSWVNDARAHCIRIESPQARIHSLGAQLPGQMARMKVSHRNVDKLWFIARRLDVAGLMKEIRAQPVNPDQGERDFWQLTQWSASFINSQDWNAEQIGKLGKYVGDEVARWSAAVERGPDHRQAEATLTTPVQTSGAYVVMAFVAEPGADFAARRGRDALALGDSRAVMVLSDLALVQKSTPDGQLCVVTHAMTGQPVPEASIQAVEVWNTWDPKRRRGVWHKAAYEGTTNDQGLLLLKKPDHNPGQLHLLVTASDRVAWSGMSYWQGYSPSPIRQGDFAYCLTDRPVYRPGQPVRYKIWARHADHGQLIAQPGRHVAVRVIDPRGNTILDIGKQTDAYGSIDGDFKLTALAALGMYHIQVSPGMYLSGNAFRVEEYKKPEYEVTVTPSTRFARLGDKLSTEIQARYYFGAPVTKAAVSYKVFREEYTQRHFFPGPWDWLYGSGYGLSWYAQPWFDWWPDMARCQPVPDWWCDWYPWYRRNPVRELVTQGTGELDADGKLTVDIDTTSTLRDHGDLDHRYIVEAEVTDSSRRVIAGQGAVIATRHAFHAYLQCDQGWHRPGDVITLSLHCATAGNQPVKTDGTIAVSEIVAGDEFRETPLKQWKASTNEQGDLTFKIRHERNAQLKITFTAPDAWGNLVQAIAVVWVFGNDFDGQRYKFNDLELITDKRTYQPGDIAHVMISADRPGAYVLFSDDADNGMIRTWKMVHIPGKSMVIDVPVGEDRKPNFFLDATMVSDLRVYQQVAQICVPPEDAVMQVSVQTDKPSYKPGQQAKVAIHAATPDGRPASLVQLAISAFDQSVLYIQPMLAGSITQFFHGQVRSHRPTMQTALTDLYAAWDGLIRPRDLLDPLPPDWNGIWGPRMDDWRVAGISDLGLPDDFSFTGQYGFGEGMLVGAAAAPMPMSAPRAAMTMAKSEAGDMLVAETSGVAGGNRSDKDAAAPAEPDMVQPAVRSEFADTALWLASLVTDEQGNASAEFTVPDNLTTWQVNTWAMSAQARVGEAKTSAVATKNLLVRLETPRFFTERDEVILSAIVHNYLSSAKSARVRLQVPSALMQIINDPRDTFEVRVDPNGEARVEWRVKILREGSAEVTVSALTDEESDAMKLTIPAVVHGITKQVAVTGMIRPDEPDKSVTVELEVPEARRPEMTKLEVQYAPSLVGAMLDALPYCLDYPYGCTEQTMSRFLPAVLTLKTLRGMGIDLEQIKQIRGRMAENLRIARDEHFHFFSYADSPVFDTNVMNDIIAVSLQRIAFMQNGDGGWGWWKGEASNAYLTSYVLFALQSAKEADVAIDDGMVQRGNNWLKQWTEREMRNKDHAIDAGQAFTAHVLSMSGDRAAIKPERDDKRPGDLIERLWIGRDTLNLYGKALLAMTMANLKDNRARDVLRNIMQWKQENAETQVAWFKTPDQGWWHWWNNDIETNSWILRAIVKLEPRSDVGPKLVKWLLNNRRNGYYWRSTRDTTLCVAAMADFVAASGEGDADYTLTLDFDGGKSIKTVRISKETFFTYDNRFVVEGPAVGGGKRTLKITRTGKGAVYFNAYLRYFTMEEPITAAGHELHVDRRYFRLQPIPWKQSVEGAQGQALEEQQLRYERVALKSGDMVQSGDLVQVELQVSGDNDYTYLALEDPKPAGLEPVDLRSGGQSQEGFGSYMELRDTKTVFFVSELAQGEHLLRYRLRAQTPGIFHTLPTQFYGMYVPELRANSDETILRVVDR
ncbi:MAG: hypothetical protein IT440_08050 [Phycisphaeraceae bacterium]|nr:hypothetical protein [Phycisphaeraceae bacterium]